MMEKDDVSLTIGFIDALVDYVETDATIASTATLSDVSTNENQDGGNNNQVEDDENNSSEGPGPRMKSIEVSKVNFFLKITYLTNVT